MIANSAVAAVDEPVRLRTGWSVVRLNRILIGIKDGTHGTYPRVTENGRLFLSAKNVQDGYLRVGDEESFVSESDFLDIVANGYPKFGDVLLTIVGTIGRVSVFEEPVPIAFQRSVCFLRFDSRQSPAYMSYMLRSGYFQDQLIDRSKSAAQAGVYMGDVAACSVYSPPFGEQEQISAYLDAHTAKIDVLIEKQERLIETLAERRQAVISHSVTKGINPNSPLEDSKVEWLRGSQIPSHWPELKMGLVSVLRSGDAITAEAIEQTGSYPVFGGGGFRGYTESFNNTGIHVLIGRQGALCGNVKTVSGDFFASEHAIVSYPRMPLDHSWWAAVLLTMNLGQYSQSAAQPGLSVDVISRLRLPVPPLAEQIEIGRYIEQETMQIETLSAKAREMIEVLKERRQALISAAVTGKIDVRGLS